MKCKIKSVGMSCGQTATLDFQKLHFIIVYLLAVSKHVTEIILLLVHLKDKKLRIIL